MGQHSTRLGDISTMQANTKNKSKGTPGYKGKHRGDKPALIPMGDPNRVKEGHTYNRADDKTVGQG